MTIGGEDGSNMTTINKFLGGACTPRNAETPFLPPLHRICNMMEYNTSEKRSNQQN